MERVISDECLDAIRRRCYEAGRAGREVYTVRDADGPKVVRCRDCKRWSRAFVDEDGVFGTCEKLSEPGHAFYSDDRCFCCWGERRGA